MINEPLFLPKGTVRAICTISFVWTICYLLVVGRIDYTVIKDIVLVVISFYFGTRTVANGHS